MSSTPESNWPSQDGVDRSRTIAIIAILKSPQPDPLNEPDFARYQRLRDIDGPFREEFGRAVSAAVDEILRPKEPISLSASHYQVGPMAGPLGPEHHIVTIWENREVIASSLSLSADAFAIVAIVREVYRRLGKWALSVNESPEVVSLSFPPAVLQAICEQHVRDVYHPRAELEARWFVITEEFYAGYQSPAHPTGSLEYLVEVTASGNTYSFWIKGTGVVTRLEVKRGKNISELPTPDLVAGNTDAAD